MSFLLSCIAAYVIFRILDALFRRRGRDDGRFMVQDREGNWYVVREIEPRTTEVPRGKPDLKIVK